MDEFDRRDAQRARERREMIDTIPTLAWSAHRDGSAEFLNRRWLDYTGLTAEEALGWGWQAAIHPDDLEGLAGKWRSSLASGTPVEAEARMRRFDGEHRWFLFRAEPLRSEAGEIVKWYGTNTDVEERRRAEEALRSSERNVRRIVDTIPGLIVRLSATGEVEAANAQVLEYFGTNLEGVKNWTTTGLVHPEDLPRAMETARQSFITGEPYEMVIRVRRFDGAYRWFQTRGVPLRNAEGQIIEWYALHTDIDDHRRSEEIVRQNQLAIRSIIDSIPGYVYTMRADGTVEFVNQRILNFFQKTAEELSDWAPLVHPEDRDAVLSQWGTALATGEPFDQIHRVRRADGEWRWFHSRGLPLRDASGQIARWCNLLVDIDERKKAEDALLSSQRELSVIIATMPGLVWCASPDGELSYVSRRILDYLGTERNDLLSGGWVHFMHPDDVASAVASWSHSVASGETFEGQSRLRGTDGAYRWFHSVCQLNRDSNGTPTRWSGLMIDIDERKRIEEALKSTREQLSRAAQVATLGELSASIAHEVNQPLAAVVANGHACLRWLAAQPPNLMKAQEAAERVVRDGKEAGEVVKRIRALFRRTEHQRVELNLNSVIVEVVSLIRSEAVRQQISVAMELHEGLPAVLGDRVQFQQLILNILINSIEAMSFVEDRPKRIVVRSKREDCETVLVEIVDSGAGFNQTDPIFDPFFSTKVTGMGMGLAICRSIVENHRGQIWAANAPGSGAMFCFRLPSAGSGS